MQLQNNSGFGLVRLTHLCGKLDDLVAKQFDLTIDQLHCIICLRKEEPYCVKELTQLLAVRNTRTSKLLRAIEERGFIERRFDPQDKRVDRIALTTEGLTLSQDIVALYMRLVDNVARRLPDEEGNALRKVVAFLAQSGAMTAIALEEIDLVDAPAV